MVRRSLTFVLAGLVCLALPAMGGAGETKATASPFKGEYFVTENKDDICVPYTRNLNQFRRLDFDVCDPRLSEKFPQFTRPTWEEIPFDLGVAETIIMNLAHKSTGAGDPFWAEWLKVSAPLRAEGTLKLWQTRIDIDNDRAPETLLRLDNPLRTEYSQGRVSWTVVPNACPYRDGILYMAASPNASMWEGFNRIAYAITDILHFSGGLVRAGSYNAYYGVDWRLGLPSWAIGKRIGATRGLKVYALFNMGAGECCSIDWVLTGQYRPLKW